MPVFSIASKNRLATCDPRLIRLFNEVIKHYDCIIIQGHRTVAEQQALYAQGRTKPGPVVTQIDGIRTKGQHNFNPSRAVDVGPYPLDWNDLPRFIHFAGFVKGVAIMLGIKIRWGGDWDSDNQQSDERFRDFPHFEVID